MVPATEKSPLRRSRPLTHITPEKVRSRSVQEAGDARSLAHSSGQFEGRKRRRELLFEIKFVPEYVVYRRRIAGKLCPMYSHSPLDSVTYYVGRVEGEASVPRVQMRGLYFECIRFRIRHF